MWHLVNRPDLILKHFGYGQLCPLRPACSQNRAGLYMPDTTSSIRFFQRRPGSYCAKSARIRSGWPAQLRKQAGVQESSGRFPAECNRRAISFPFSASVVFIHTRPESYCAKQALIRFGFGQTDGSGPEARRWAGTIWPFSGQRFRADPYRMRIGSG